MCVSMQKGSLVVKRLISRVREVLKEYVKQGDRLLVGVSGGPDSLCLLDVLVTLREEFGYELEVIHVNHGLRPASDYEAKFVEQFAMKYGLGVHIIKVRVKNMGEGIEAAARRARYEAFFKIRNEIGARYIVVAHTANDQVETVLYRFFRGTGPFGLAAMEIKNKQGILRPFLNIERNDIEKYLKYKGISWVEDESNESQKFDRNFIRLKVLPLIKSRFGAVTQHIIDLSMQIQDMVAIVQEVIQKQIERLVLYQDMDGVILDRVAFNQIPEVQKGFVIMELLKSFYHDGGWHKRGIDSVVRLAGSDRDTGALDLQKISAFVTPKKLVIQRVVQDWKDFEITNNTVFGDFELIVGNNTSLPVDLWGAVFPEEVRGHLYVRHPEKGDRIDIHGLKGTKKVFKALQDKKIPRIYRSLWPIITHKITGEVLWIPGVARSKKFLYDGGDALYLKMNIHRRFFDHLLKYMNIKS